MRKIKKLMLSLLLTLTITLTMISCMNNEWLLKDGYFTYSYEKNGDIVLGGLTDEGKQQETLVFPSMINGKKVIGVGIEKSGPSGKIRVQFFESDKLKKIYFPKGYSVGPYTPFYEKLPNVECVYTVNGLNRLLPQSECITYWPNDYLMKKKEVWGDDFYESYPNSYNANVTYYMNDGTDDVYFVDHVSGTKVNVMPSTPYREGYTFRAWYKDKELTTLWDFENDIIPEIKLDDNGNEIIEETKIYAGWDSKNEK